MPRVKTKPVSGAETTAEIVDIGSGGDGIARFGSQTGFVPYGVTGDRIVCRPPSGGKPERLAGVRLLAPGAERAPPPCPHHGDVGVDAPDRTCGGCRMQQLAMPAYQAWKTRLVTAALGRAGVSGYELDALAASPAGSRRRASLTAERTGTRTALGFQQRGSHRIVDMHTCLILRPELFALVAPLRNLAILNDRERADYVLTVLDGTVDLVIERKRELTLPEREALGEFAQAHDLGRISWRDGPRGVSEPVAHRRPLYARFGPAIGGGLLPVPPGGFLQATAEGEAALQRFVMDALPQPCRTLDLFAGSGTFSVPASTRGPVRAVDSNAEALAALRFAGRPGLATERRDLFAEPVTRFGDHDAVIMDPPYAGASAQAAALAASGPELVVSISCNPVSFARDAAVLQGGGYRLERVMPVDQFLWSAEVEIAGVFRR